MASIIKNQIVKHLSKFTKNLSPDKIQLSTLKGEGELSNLELNEDVLMELMDLPTWLTLTKAVCNKVSIKIQWSKLKSQPIRVYLDEVMVSMNMSETLREPASDPSLPSYSSGGRYGFLDRVVDGMYVQINTVVINFTSEAFSANLNISRVIVQSKTPTWRVANDLQYTRISEKHRDLLMTFKEIDWQTLKIEADCMVGNKQQTTPLRLITNQSKIRITVKKRYSDSSIVATKVQFIMDDLLWILTDSQSKAAAVFARHLKSNIDKANERSKLRAAHTIQKQKQAQQKPNSQYNSNSPATSLFNKFDIAESSYHVQTHRIDLHICDDVNIPNKTRGVHGGAVGIAFMKLNLSHYPARPVGDTRKNWSNYNDSMEGRDIWTKELLKNYILQLSAKVEQGVIKLKPEITPEIISKGLIERVTTFCVEDFFITTASRDTADEQRPAKLLMSDKKALFLPKEMSALYAEQTEYFFSHKTSIPIPCPNLYVKLNPIKLTVDTFTIQWFNSFALSLAKDVEDLISSLPIDLDKKKERIDIRLEALMPKIVVPSTEQMPLYQHDRPDALQIIISRVVITNNHLTLFSSNNSKSAFTNLLGRYKRLKVSTEIHQFPNEEHDMPLLSSQCGEYASESRHAYTTHKDLPHEDTGVETFSFELEQFWIEFTGVKNSGSRPVSFLESFPVTVWMIIPPELKPEKEKRSLLHEPLKRIGDIIHRKRKTSLSKSSHLCVLVEIGAKICAQINHYQLCFLMRLADSMTAMMDTMAKEENLHSELKTSPRPTSSDQPIQILTAVIHIREVQFAMLAAPMMNAVTSERSSSPSPTDTESTNSPELDEPIDCGSPELERTVLAGPEVDPTAVQMGRITPDDSGDSGVATTTSNFSSDPDIVLEKSAFYHDPNAVVGHRKASRSSFYGADTLLPPSGDGVPISNKFTSAFTKMTSKVKSSINKVVEDDSWDTLSIMSDDTEFLTEITNQEEEAAFTSHHAGLNDDELESVSNYSRERPKQLISVTMFRICDIEVGAEVIGTDITAKVMLEGVDNTEKGNMYYDDFQAEQLNSMNSYSDPAAHSHKPVRVRFSKGQHAAHLAFGADEKGFAHVRVVDYSMSLLSSTISKLGPLFKDELIGDPLPLLIEVDNFDLDLQDDAASVYNTANPDIPMQLHVDHVSLIRTMDGVFTVRGKTSETTSVLHEHRVLKVDKATGTSPPTTPAISALEELPVLQESTINHHKPTETHSASAQLLLEMKFLQEENKALKEQILRLNDKLIEKDHEEFHRVESSGHLDSNSQLVKDLEFYKKETKLLRSQILDDGENIDRLTSTNECLAQTVELLKGELAKSDSRPDT